MKNLLGFFTVVLVSSSSMSIADPWNGFYFGAGIQSWESASNPAPIGFLGFKGQIGTSIVAGAEIEYYTEEEFRDYFVNARAGVLLSPKALIYASGGVGYYSFVVNEIVEDADEEWKLGIGAEYAMTDSMTIRAEFSNHNCCGRPVFDGPRTALIAALLSF